MSRIVRWFRQRREAARLVNADAEALIRDHGGAAYWETRRRARDVILPDGTTHQPKNRNWPVPVWRRIGHFQWDDPRFTAHRRSPRR